MPSRRTLPGALLLAAGFALGGCASQGREVFVREGCPGCHRFGGMGGGGAPDLTYVASRRSGASIRAQITNPGGGTSPTSRMPAFRNLSWFDLYSLSAFLQSGP
ncbi:MAG TPA: c-type cytochrome [bacterium]